MSRAAAPNRIFVLDGAFVFCGRLDATELHAHQALQLSYGLDRPLDLRARAGDAFRAFPSACVAANAPHELRAHGARTILIYVDALHRLCRTLAPAGSPPIAPLRHPTRGSLERLWRAADPGTAAAAAADVVGVASLRRELRALDARVRTVVRTLEAACPAPVRVTALAAQVGLSPSRLGHLFAREVGVTIPRYGLWLRLRAAAAAIEHGRSLTELAHASGFADSAHFARTVRAMFGMRPSDIAFRSEFVQAPAPGAAP